MAGDFIGIDTQGIAELNAKLSQLPVEARSQVVNEVSKYLINVLKTYPPQKYVTRKQAYGQTFVSDRQRKWFFAALNSGDLRIPYHRRRSHGIQGGWKQIGSGYNSIIANEVPGVQYVMGDDTQSRHERMVGWRTIGQIVKERMTRMLEVADGAIKKALRKLRLI